VEEDGMVMADLVSGKVTEPLSVRAPVGERAAEPGDVSDLAERHDARTIDLKFTDLPGTWQHMGMALGSLNDEALADGIGFDARRSAASERSTSRTCCCFPICPQRS
jgi:glutamine synthetase